MLGRNRVQSWRRQGVLLTPGFPSLEAEFEARLQAQRSRCACCRLPFKRGNPDPRQIEHDHETGRVRGVVCARCNTWVAILRDGDIERGMEEWTGGFAVHYPDGIGTEDEDPDETLGWLEAVGMAQLVTRYIASVDERAEEAARGGA